MVPAMWGGEWDVQWFQEVDSTNTYVRDRARQGAPAGFQPPHYGAAAKG